MKEIFIFLGPCVALGAVGYYFILKWQQRNPYCNRCGTRGRGVEQIKLRGMDTSYLICQECKAWDVIEHGEYEWACVLYNLHRMAKNISDGYDVKSLIFWPMDSAHKVFLSMDEIMVKVTEK